MKRVLIWVKISEIIILSISLFQLLYKEVFKMIYLILQYLTWRVRESSLGSSKRFRWDESSHGFDFLSSLRPESLLHFCQGLCPQSDSWKKFNGWKWERIWAALQPRFLMRPHQSTVAWLLGSCGSRHAVYRGHWDLKFFLPFSPLLSPFHLRKEFSCHDSMVTKGYHVWNFIH